MHRWLTALLMICASATVVAGASTRIEVAVHSGGAKFIGDKTGGAQVEILDEDGNVIASGVTAGSTGNTDAIMNATLAHLENALDENASVMLEVDLVGPRRLTVRATAPLGFPEQTRTAATEVLVFPGSHLEGERSLVFTLFGLILAPEENTLGPDGGAADLTFMMLCGCPITPDGLWDFNDYALEAHITRECEGKEPVALKHVGPGPRYRLQLEGSGGTLTSVAVHGQSIVHPQLSGQVQLYDSGECE